MSELDNLREALSKISDIAGAAVRKVEGNDYEHADMADQGICTPKSLPQHLQVKAAKTATDINPMKLVPVFGFMPADDTVAALVSNPLQHCGPNFEVLGHGATAPDGQFRGDDPG